MKDVAALAERGRERLNAMETAGRTPHPFVPHRRDSECDACGLGQTMAVHQQGRLEM